MKFKNDKIGLYLTIDDRLIANIQNIGLKHFPNEFGGVLIGRYSDDKKTVIIEDIILPKSYKSSKYSFERGAEGLKEQLLSLYHSPISQIYLGEWHTHPDAPPLPSGTDIIALNQIVKHVDVNINSPVLLIVGLSPKKMELGFYVYFKDKIYKYDEEESRS